MTEFDKSEQARGNFAAGLRLHSDYYSAGQAIGSTLIAVASGILVASIAVVEKIRPLSESSNDWAVYGSWILLGATPFLGFVFLWIGGRSLRRYADYLVKRGEAYVPGGGVDDAKMNAADKALGEARCLATAREGALLGGLLTLVAALALLAVYVTVGEAGAEKLPTEEVTEVGPPAQIDVIGFHFIPVDEAEAPCTGTVTLEAPNEPTDIAIYSAVNGVLSGQADTVRIGEGGGREPRHALCLPVSPELKEVIEGPPETPPIIEYFIDFGHPVNAELLEERDLAAVLEAADYSTPPTQWDSGTEPPP